eukprot:COSAG02_NODE_195_length_29750_cov_79.793329_30_plen_72_part_00
MARTESPKMGLPVRRWISAVTSATVWRWSHGTMACTPPGAATFSRTFPMSSVEWNSGSAAGTLAPLDETLE